MYGSRVKRLCVEAVRGATSDDTRIVQQQHSSPATLISPHLIMTASTIGIATADETSNGTLPTNTTHYQDYRATTANNSSSSAIPSTSSTSHSISSSSSPTGNVEQELINRLASETLEEKVIEILLSIRNTVTACNKKKDAIVNNPSFKTIVDLLDSKSTSPSVKTQLVLLICSIAKSGENNIRILNELQIDDKIFNLFLSTQDDILIEACLRCLRSIISWPNVSRTWLVYDHACLKAGNRSYPNLEDNNKESSLNCLEKLISYGSSSSSFVVQECVADILASACNHKRDQTSLKKVGAISCAIQYLESPASGVIVGSLNWLWSLSLDNYSICQELAQARCPSGITVLDCLLILMRKDRCNEVQFLSARCYANVYKTLSQDILKNDMLIVNQVLPTLIRMVQPDKPAFLRLKSAECIAQLTDSETRLQNTASICDHLIESLASMLDYEPRLVANIYDQSMVDKANCWIKTKSPVVQHEKFELKRLYENNQIVREMRRVSFLALASLASQLEVVRKRIFNTCAVMSHLVKTLSNDDPEMLKASLTCLLSLSRSVHQLRTSFAENSVYCALKNLLNSTSEDILVLVLGILCNLLLEFSPDKQHFLDSKTIETLCNFTKRSDPLLKLHGVWILMNMVYQLKDQNLKYQILRALGISHMLSLLEDDDDELVIKTLGFMRNLLSHKSHIDTIMGNHGELIIHSLEQILDKPKTSNRIKEQALCVLSNIADGNESKTFIMSNRAILTYLAKTMCDDAMGDLRLAAIVCITNLVHKSHHGIRDEMKKLGIEEKLKFMLTSNDSDPLLNDRLRTAYSHFLINVDEKYELK